MIPRNAPVAIQKPVGFLAVSVEGPYDLCCGRLIVSERLDSNSNEERTAIEKHRY